MLLRWFKWRRRMYIFFLFFTFFSRFDATRWLLKRTANLSSNKTPCSCAITVLLQCLLSRVKSFRIIITSSKKIWRKKNESSSVNWSRVWKTTSFLLNLSSLTLYQPIFGILNSNKTVCGNNLNEVIKIVNLNQVFGTKQCQSLDIRRYIINYISMWCESYTYNKGINTCDNGTVTKLLRNIPSSLCSKRKKINHLEMATANLRGNVPRMYLNKWFAPVSLYEDNTATYRVTERPDPQTTRAHIIALRNDVLCLFF